MEKGKRKKILNLVAETIRDTLYFGRVVADPPGDPFPTALELPSVNVIRGLEPLSDLTNKDKHSEFGFETVVVVQADEDLELVKCDAQDVIEEALMNLQTDSAFTALAVMIKVDSADPTPRALADLGLTQPILPPFGVIRMRGRVLFDYVAID
jgi:hypothetical protein